MATTHWFVRKSEAERTSLNIREHRTNVELEVALKSADLVDFARFRYPVSRNDVDSYDYYNDNPFYLMTVIRENR